MTLWSRWVARTSATEGATPLALFRIGMGISVLVTLGSVWLHGLVPVLWVDQAHGGYRALGQGPWLVALLGGPQPAVVWPLLGAASVCGLLLLLGIGGRGVALLTLLTTKGLVDINGHAGGSYDELLANGLWLLVLGNGQATLSVSAWRQTGDWWPRAEVLAFPRWLAAFQLVLMYSMTGVQKLSVHWVPGGDASALYYILQQPTWQRVDMAWLAWVFPLTQLATLITWFWEVLSPLWLLAMWCPAVRGAWQLRAAFAAVGLILHISIFVTMDVGPFTLISLAFYPAMVHPWELRRLTGRG